MRIWHVILICSFTAATSTAFADMISTGTLELVESVPEETVLDLPEIRNTPEVWMEMIRGAVSTIDIETFYFSVNPQQRDMLRSVLDLLADASNRNVAIRAISDSGFDGTYPEVRSWMDSLPNAHTRTFDVRDLWGGILHAKFFVVDSTELFVGSQNWDWRALRHIHELGVRIRHPLLARALLSVFEMDWTSSGGIPPLGIAAPAGSSGPHMLALASGEPVRVQLAGSPKDGLPEHIPWDLPLLLDVIDSARTEIRLHLLTYSPVDQDKYHPELENALKRAAARGVSVRVILSNWSKRESLLPHVLSLAATPNISIRFTNIPEWSGGFIPFARVEHPKYLVADRDACWLGTSNWTPSGFFKSRNISMIMHGEPVASRIIEFFDQSWSSLYAEEVELCGTYEPPRRTE